MRFLANENFPLPSVHALRRAGHDVESIAESHSGWKDVQVLAHAVQSERIILTFDRDYGELLFRYQLQPPPDVVFFRNKGTQPTAVAMRLMGLMANESIRLMGYFTVVEDDTIRQRKLIS